MKKKLIAILLAATCALTAGLTGCSGNAATSGTDESKTSDAQSTGDSTAKSDVVAGFVYIAARSTTAVTHRLTMQADLQLRLWA